MKLKYEEDVWRRYNYLGKFIFGIQCFGNYVSFQAIWDGERYVPIAPTEAPEQERLVVNNGWYNGYNLYLQPERVDPQNYNQWVYNVTANQ
jgi:hypothetical protein